MTDKKQKIDQLWVVEGTSGRYVKVVKQGRKWLHLESQHGWDAPCANIDDVIGARKAEVREWTPEARAYLSEEYWRREVRREALILAFRIAFGRWVHRDAFTLEGLETAAKALGIEVKDG